ncbi:MAG: ABC transporter ATP-binding protein [Oscillospiraceae bacterium]|jgi:oligopeptide/dipeptide ABC transporter ATP-binding protein|nr:ABC transporter ATP-binding protein [Oscillospiraceae bacterium]
MENRKVVLEIKNLHVHFITDSETVKAVNGVDMVLHEGECLGLVGETGAGKTTTALSIMQLVPDPPGVIVDGEICFRGKNIIYNTDSENRNMRGNGISMIFQDPMTALNPIMTVGSQLSEVIIQHRKVSRKQAKEMAVQLMELVGVKADRYDDYPHQFSGGMKQRVVIAMALLCRPEILIADEPTTALDVTIQAQVIEIIRDLIEQFHMSMILISHDLGVVAETCDQVAIMYAGEIVEAGHIREVYQHALHPYTVGLFSSIPRLDDDSEKLIPIEGQIPNSAALPEGCKFHPRCKHCQEVCRLQPPPVQREGEHIYRCHFKLF